MDERQVKAAISYGGSSVAKVAREAFPEITRAAVLSKIQRGTMKDEDLRKIAEAVGARYIPASIVFPDGFKVGGEYVQRARCSDVEELCKKL